MRDSRDPPAAPYRHGPCVVLRRRDQDIHRSRGKSTGSPNSMLCLLVSIELAGRSACDRTRIEPPFGPSMSDTCGGCRHEPGFQPEGCRRRRTAVSARRMSRRDRHRARGSGAVKASPRAPRSRVLHGSTAMAPLLRTRWVSAGGERTSESTRRASTPCCYPRCPAPRRSGSPEHRFGPAVTTVLPAPTRAGVV